MDEQVKLLKEELSKCSYKLGCVVAKYQTLKNLGYTDSDIIVQDGLFMVVG